MHEVEVNGERYLLDCGTFQGRRRESRERNASFPWPANRIRAVLLSHAHIDHSGNLPTLVKNGFGGPIYTTPATADLCEPLLLDSAYLQERDAHFLNKRTARRRSLELPGGADEPIQPVHTVEDAERTLPLFRRIQLHTAIEPGPALTYESFDAGHVLGSTFQLLKASGVRLIFSGDIGRPRLPIVPDPETPPPADFLILESTYGDRLHKAIEHVSDKLAAAVVRTAERGGRIVVPAFALGRTQQLILLLHELTAHGRIPNIPIFIDSPLAVKTTKVFQANRQSYDSETTAWLKGGTDPFQWRQIRYIQDVNESKALNDLHGPLIVISASGMCEGGRILHHLRNSIENPRNTVLIPGFQAEHTLGRKIVEKHPEVPIFGDMMRLRAEVVKLNELSGHADQRELLMWMKPLARNLRRVFLVHGEWQQQQALAQAIQEQYGIAVTIPSRGQSFEL
jgi:metallo-beta-lactamase family protein